MHEAKSVLATSWPPRIHVINIATAYRAQSCSREGTHPQQSNNITAVIQIAYSQSSILVRHPILGDYTYTRAPDRPPDLSVWQQQSDLSRVNLSTLRRTPIALYIQSPLAHCALCVLSLVAQTSRILWTARVAARCIYAEPAPSRCPYRVAFRGRQRYFQQRVPRPVKALQAPPSTEHTTLCALVVSSYSVSLSLYSAFVSCMLTLPPSFASFPLRATYWLTISCHDSAVYPYGTAVLCLCVCAHNCICIGYVYIHTFIDTHTHTHMYTRTGNKQNTGASRVVLLVLEKVI